MKPFYENLFAIDEAEGPNQSLPDFHLISIQVKFLPDFFETTRTLPSLFDFGDFSFDSHWHHGWHRFEVDHDDTWEHFGRAYYSSCDYQITEFSFTLYSVDELKRQIEEWERYFAQNLMLWVPPCLSDEVHASRFIDHYFAERSWDEELCAWMDDYKTSIGYTKYSWEADGHSCRPYHDRALYLHHLVKPSLCGRIPQARTASRLRCRSSLMASCHRDTGDDLLGH
jgi:hypothetical protein